MAKQMCKAVSKSTGEPCKRTVVPGAVVCRWHGGAAKQVREKGQLRVFEGQVRELFGKQAPEVKPVDNPLAAYADLAGRVTAWMEHMDRMLDDLKIVGYEGQNGEQIKAAVQLYERAMDRANSVLGSYARLNIDDRLAKITEVQANVITRAIEAVIAYFGATSEQAIAARQLAARHLKAVT